MKCLVPKKREINCCLAGKNYTCLSKTNLARFRHYLVLAIHPDVFNNEDHIKSRKNCCLQIYVILCGLQEEKRVISSPSEVTISILNNCKVDEHDNRP